MSSAVAELNRLRKTVAGLSPAEENARYRAVTAELEVELAQLEERNRMLEAKVEELAAFEAQLRPLREQLEAKRLLELELRQKIQSLELDAKNFLSTIDDLKKQLTAALEWERKHAAVTEELTAFKAKYKEDLLRARREFEQEVKALRVQVQEKEEEKAELARQLKASQDETQAEAAAHRDTRRRLQNSELELQGVRLQMGKLAHEYRTYQDSVEQKHAAEMEALRTELSNRHVAELDKQARAAVARISTLERSLADQAMLHEQERARASRDLGALQARLQQQPDPDHPLVEDEDVAVLVKRLRSCLDRVSTDPAALVMLADTLSALADLAADSLPSAYQIARFGALPLVQRSLSLADAPTVRFNSFSLLGALARHEDVKNELAPLLPLLVPALGDVSTEIVSNALAALRMLSRDEQRAADAVRLGAVRLLVPLLYVDDPLTRRNAMAVLRDVSFLAAAKEEVRALAGVRPIVECVADSQDAELSGAALEACALLAVNPENRNELRRAGFLPLCVEALRHDVSRTAALTALVPLTINLHNKLELRDGTCFAQLAALGQTASGEALRNIVRILCNLSMSDECKPALREAGTLPLLVSAAGSRDTEVQKYGVRGLAYMAANDAARAELERLETTPPLLSCLSSADEQTVRDAVDALLRVTQTNSARMALKRAGGVKAIVRLCMRCNVSTHVKTKHGCMSLLASLATLAELRTGLVAEPGLFEDVVAALRSPHNELHRAGLTYLVAFLSDDELFLRGPLLNVARGVLLPNVIAQFAKSPDYDTLALACRAAVSLIRADSLRPDFLKADGAALLTRGLSSVSTAPQRAATAAAAVLAEYPEARARVAEFVRPLVALLKTDDPETKRNAAVTLSHAVHAPDVRRACEAVKATESLELCAGTYDTATREAALAALNVLQRGF